MAQKIDKDIYNPTMYKEKFDKSSKDELSFFNDLNQRINHKIQSNQQITINNLNEIKHSLESIRSKANQITESIINHDEHMIVKKQKVISDALKNIHNNNFNVFQFESEHLDQRVFSIESLHNQLVESNMEYFRSYKLFLKGTIDNIKTNYAFLKKKSEAINYVIDKHFTEISDAFKELDQRISKIDETIKELMATKSLKEDVLDEFFDIEIKNLTDTQINFCINEDPFSDNIQKLTETKKQEFNQYKAFLHKQEERLKSLFTTDVEEKYNEYYHQNYSKHQKQSKAEKYAKKKIKTYTKDKKQILLSFRKDNQASISRMQTSLNLYLKLYKTDPFLAQLFFDEGARIVSQEVDFTRLYKMNKSLKYHMYFTYKLAQLNHQIKLYEYDFVHYIQNKFTSQEIDFINVIKDIKAFLIDNQSSVDATQIALKRDKKFILYLNDLMDAHIDYQMKRENHTRVFLSEFSKVINTNVRNKADMDIQLLNHTSDILLALKESEIDTLHFKHMYENEKRLLLIQQNRIQSENDINYDLMLSTFSNQMRFAKEQIKLAEEEFKLRLSAIVHNIDSERIHYYDMINHEVDLKEDAAQSEFAHYQKQVYDIITEIENTDDKKLKSVLEKALDEVKTDYRKKIDQILEKYRSNHKIRLYQKRLEELDMYLEDAYLAASKIYDKTIQEMDEIYRYAEIKYNEIIEAVDKDAFPLDDFLYEALQESKKRLNEKMLYAEITLDEKVGSYIDSYKKLYFKLNLKFDSKDILKQLDSHQEQLALLEDNYHDTLDGINQDYALSTENYNHKIRALKNQYQQEMDATILEKNQIIQSKTQDINSNDKTFKDFMQKVSHKHQVQLKQIIEDYLDQMKDNQDINQAVDMDYEKLIQAYRPYIKYSKKSRSIRKVIRQMRKQHKKDLKIANKKIKTDIKSIRFI